MTGRVAWLQAWPVPPAALAGSDAVAWVGTGAMVEARLQAVALTEADRRDVARHPAPLRPDALRRRRCLRRAVADLLACDPAAVLIEATPEGRPRLLSPQGFWLSSSARDDRIGIALARAPVGIDVEVVGPPSEPPWNVLAASERAALRAQAPAARWIGFLTLWTAKEAYLKALGLGLAREPAEIAVEVTGEAVALRDRGVRVGVGAAASRLFGDPSGGLRAACIVLAP